MRVFRRNMFPLVALFTVSGQELLWAFDPVIECGTCDCTMTVDWRLPVDLNGDDVPDFDHIRLQTEKRCGEDVWWTLQRDEIEAFYPEPHVDVFVYYNRRIVTPYRAALSPGQSIPPAPNPDCSWPAEDCWDWVSRVPDAQRILQAEGLGVIFRRTDWYPCHPDGGCAETAFSGVIGVADPQDQTATGLFGFRSQQADGWHLAWVRILYEKPWPWSFDERPVGGISLLDYAIHPEPETPIAAGEPPRPTLHASVEGDEIVLSWHPAWTGYVLERSPAVSGGAWEPVPDVENNTARLPKAGPPAFFRLEQE